MKLCEDTCQTTYMKIPYFQSLYSRLVIVADNNLSLKNATINLIWEFTHKHTHDHHRYFTNYCTKSEFESEFKSKSKFKFKKLFKPVRNHEEHKKTNRTKNLQKPNKWTNSRTIKQNVRFHLEHNQRIFKVELQKKIIKNNISNNNKTNLEEKR